jgi:hypothetical protein
MFSLLVISVIYFLLYLALIYFFVIFIWTWTRRGFWGEGGVEQRSTKHTYKTKDRVTRTPLKTGGERKYSGRVSSSCSTSGTRRVNLVTNPVISREWGKDREVFTTSGTYPWSFVTQIFHNSQPNHGGDRKTFEVMTSKIIPGLVILLIASIPLSLK